MEGTEAETEPVNWEICNESYKFQNMVGGQIFAYIPPHLSLHVCLFNEMNT